MTPAVIIGCDPGASGAIACLDATTGQLLWVEDMPVVDGLVSGALVADLLEGEHVTVAVIEQVGAMPKQGVSSTWKFAENTGRLVGAFEALRIPTTRVAPTVWKRAFGLGRDKGESRRRAIELWPTFSARFARVKDDGRAEAALIAEHHRRTRTAAAA